LYGGSRTRCLGGSRFILWYRSINQYGRFAGCGGYNGAVLHCHRWIRRQSEYAAAPIGTRFAVAIKFHFMNFKQA
jgi:hypothetical protein